MLPGTGIDAAETLHRTAGNGLLYIAGLDGLSRPGSAGGCHQFPVGGNKLQFQHIAFPKGLGKTDAGLVEILVILADIVLKEAGTGFRLGSEVCQNIGIIVNADGQREKQHGKNDQHNRNADAAQHPAFFQTCRFFQPDLHLLPCLSQNLKTDQLPHL